MEMRRRDLNNSFQGRSDKGNSLVFGQTGRVLGETLGVDQSAELSVWTGRRILDCDYH